MRRRQFTPPAASKRFLDEKEAELSAQLAGKTLLGEIIFPLEVCDEVAIHLRAVVESAGQLTGSSFVTKSWPLVVGTWLVNEAFYNFASGEYWPPTLSKLGVVDIGNCSTRFGKAFLELLRDRGLPRFNRLKTRWYYLGPILGHCGVPRSCLPELFEKVLPRAAELGVGDGGSFDELRLEAPCLYLRRATERFVVFGDRIAEGFVVRALEMDRLWRSQGFLPSVGDLGLPARVVEAYREWAESTGAERRLRASRDGRSFRRPELRLDPHQGVVLDLPSQKLESAETAVQWTVDQDSRPAVRVETRSLPGERNTLPESMILAEPFGLLRVHATLDGLHVGSWSLEGLSRLAPILLFDPDSMKLVNARSLGAQLAGVVHPRSLRIELRSDDGTAAAAVVENVARPLPLSWSELDAVVYDLSDGEAMLVLDEKGAVQLEIELQDASYSASLESVGEESTARDGCRVFVGAAPILRLPPAALKGASAALEAWTIEIRSLGEVDGARESEIVSLAGKVELARGEAATGRPGIHLDELLAMGSEPWCEMSLRVRGPLGQDARFHFRVVPRLQIDFSWLDATGVREDVDCTIKTPESSTLRGAVLPAGPNAWTMRAPTAGAGVVLEIQGFGGRMQQIPLEVGARTPSWALYDPAGDRHLVRWGREPFILPLREAVATSPALLLRLVTPRGNARRAALVVAGPEGEVLRSPLALDEQGFCRAELLPALTAASASGASRLDVLCEIDIGGVVALRCGALTRTWAPSGFSSEVEGDRVCFRWQDQFPVAERCVEIVSLLTPWDEPLYVAIPPDAHGSLTVDAADAFAGSGRYLASLGLSDPWTGSFERAAVPAVKIEVGESDDWRRGALDRESPVDPDAALRTSDADAEQPQDDDPESESAAVRDATASLVSLLIDLTSEEATSPDVSLIDLPSSGEFARRILAARTTLGRAGAASQAVRGLDRLLHRLPPSCALSALHTFEGQIDVRTFLDWDVFARGAALRTELGTSEDARARMSPSAMESLWRLWPPLGLWADTILLEVAPMDAARRIVGHLGADTVRRVCALVPGGMLNFKSLTGEKLFRSRVVRVVSGEDLGPLEVEGLSPGVAVEVELEQGGQVIVSRRADGAWTFEAGDGASLPEAIAVADREVLETAYVVSLYRRELVPFGAPPEYQLLQLVRHQHRAILQQIQDHSRLPVEPVGPAAFATANFAWCMRADESVVRRLADMCAALVPDLEPLMEIHAGMAHGPSAWWTLRALQRRWIPNSHQEPLYAVPLVCGAAAATMLWRGLGRSALFPISEELLDRTLPVLVECAPELFAHDLMMVCLAEATAAARRWPNADRSVQTDA